MDKRTRRQRGAASSGILGSLTGTVLAVAAGYVGWGVYAGSIPLPGPVAELVGRTAACDETPWAPVVSVEHNFTYTPPCRTEPEPYDVEEAGAPGIHYEARTGGGELYGAAVVDVSGQIREFGEPDPDLLLWEARKFLMKESESELVKKRFILLDGEYAGREYWSRWPDGQLTFWRAYYVPPKVYLIEAGSKTHREPTAAHLAFLDSFSLLEDPLAGARERERAKRAAAEKQQGELDAIFAARAAEEAERQAKVQARMEADRGKRKAAAEAFVGRSKDADWYNR